MSTLRKRYNLSLDERLLRAHTQAPNILSEVDCYDFELDQSARRFRYRDIMRGF